jgi:hypothetical protein
MNVVLDILILKSKFSIRLFFSYINLMFRQGFWTHEDFRYFLHTLFSNKKRPYLILSDKIDQYFHETDFNQDDKIDFDEFIQAWKTTIRCVRIISQFIFSEVWLFV